MKLTPKQEKILKWLGENREEWVFAEDVGLEIYGRDEIEPFYKYSDRAYRHLKALYDSGFVDRYRTNICEAYRWKPTQAGIELLDGLDLKEAQKIKRAFEEMG